MNARQTKKLLKKRITKIQSDNDLMRRIIADSPTMQELYDLYNKPHFVTNMQLQEYRVKRTIPPYMADMQIAVEYIKQELARDFLEEIKENITYEVEYEPRITTITASIFVGRK